jgi:hypothetical protein
MSQPSGPDDAVSSASSTLSYQLVKEIAQGVQDEGLTRTPADVAGEVRLRLGRLQRAWEIASGQREI